MQFIHGARAAFLEASGPIEALYGPASWTSPGWVDQIPLKRRFCGTNGGASLRHGAQGDVNAYIRPNIAGTMKKIGSFACKRTDTRAKKSWTLAVMLLAVAPAWPDRASGSCGKVNRLAGCKGPFPTRYRPC